MANCVFVWDAEGLPPAGDWTAVLWRGFCESDMRQTVSIPELVEDNADALKARYLAWIYELGETRIKGRRLVDHLELRPGFSYWWMTMIAEKCNYAHSPLITDAIRLMAFDAWATDYSVDRIVLVSAKPSLAECMRLWCARLGVAFEWQRIAAPAGSLSSVRRIYNTLPITLRALTKLFHYVVDRWPLRGAGLKEWQQTEGQVTFVSYLFNLVPIAANEGRYESRYWAHLPDDLQHEGCKTNWLHLYLRDPLLPSAGKAASTIHGFNQTGKGEQVHVTLDSFLSARVGLKALSDWWRLAWAGRRLEPAISATASNGLSLWPLFAQDWRQSMAGPRAMINVLSLNLFESAMHSLPKQRIGIYLFENQPWEFAFAHAWKMAGHECLIGAQHATMLYWDLRYFFDPRSYRRTGDNDLPLPDQIAINGPVSLEIYLQAGYSKKDLVQVEALRYLYLYRGEAEPATDASSAPGALRLLVLGDYLTSNTQLQMRLLEKVAQSLPAGTIITVKPHPSCPIKPGDYSGLDMTVTMEPIATLLSKCDIAYASPVTSAAVDAYCDGVPVVSVRDPNTLNLNPLRGCEGALFASTPEELVHALTSAVSVPRSTETKQVFFTLDPKLPRWRKLLLDSLE